MEIIQLVGIGIVGTILAVTVRSYRPEIGIGIAIAAGLLILSAAVEPLDTAVAEMREICTDSGIDMGYFAIILKIIGIAYVMQFAAETAKDAGEGAIAKKLEFGGKAMIIAMMMPVVKNLLELINSALAGF